MQKERLCLVTRSIILKKTPPTCSKNSSATVPCPETTSMEFDDGINVDPVSAWTCAQVASRASTVGSQKTSFPPYSCIRSCLDFGEFHGRTIVAEHPRRVDAYDNAIPWLPAQNKSKKNQLESLPPPGSKCDCDTSSVFLT